MSKLKFGFGLELNSNGIISSLYSASRVEGGGYLWNVTSIVIATEFVKLLIALGLYFYTGGMISLPPNSYPKCYLDSFCINTLKGAENQF